jgi:HEAT repeat protein
VTTALAPAIQAMAPSRRRSHVPVALLVAACSVLDAVAAAILLFGTPLPPLLEGLAAAISHGTAVVLLSSSVRTPPSRRWLCVAAVLAIPFAGAAVAAVTLVTRGRRSATMRRRRKLPARPALTIAAMRHLGSALSPCDALDGGDEEQRRAALSALSRRGDPEAMAMLRRAAAGRDPDLVLSAALVLDEIGERAERQSGRRVPLEVRHGTG